jgi:hypothetical protein
MKTIITTTSDKNRIGLYSLLLFTLLLTACTKSEYKIIVPNGYIGKVCLIKSNVTSNILTLDSNGIGYINEKTFNKLRYAPSVNDASGKDLFPNCVGYSPSVFWGIGNSESSTSKLKINYLSFEIVPDSLIGKKQYYSTDLFKVADTLKIK